MRPVLAGTGTSNGALLTLMLSGSTTFVWSATVTGNSRSLTPINSLGSWTHTICVVGGNCTTFTISDTTTPSLVNFFTSTPDGSYSVGDVINISARFDEDVTSGSTMTVVLDTARSVTLTQAWLMWWYIAWSIWPDLSFDVTWSVFNDTNSLAVDYYGNIIIGWEDGFYNWIYGFTRYLPDWSIDSNFSAVWIQSNEYIKTIKVDQSNKILIGWVFTNYDGQSNLDYIARLNPDGSRDTSFNSTYNGAYIYDINIDQDGKILVAWANAHRLNTNGSIDTWFTTSWFNNAAHTIIADNSWKVLIGWWFTDYAGQSNLDYLVRLNSNGSIDTSFNHSWFNIVNALQYPIYKLIIQNDNKIIVIWWFTNYAGQGNLDYIARLNPDGSRDTSFIPVVFNNLISDAYLESDGKILIAWSFTNYAGQSNLDYIARLNPDGSRDTSFIPVAFGSRTTKVASQNGKPIVVWIFSDYGWYTNQDLIVRLDGTGNILWIWPILVGSYTVQTGDITADLTVSSITSTSVTDLAGNTYSSTTLPWSPNNIADQHQIVIASSWTLYTLQYTTTLGWVVTWSLLQTVLSWDDGSPVSAIADPWYSFVWWSDNDTSNPRTDTNVTNYINVTALFTSNSGTTFTLEYTWSNGGIVSWSLLQTVLSWANGSPVSAIALSWYTFLRWDDNNTSNPRTDSNVTSNINIIALFTGATSGSWSNGSGSNWGGSSWGGSSWGWGGWGWGGWGWGGWGGSSGSSGSWSTGSGTIATDICLWWDFSPSPYDGICGTWPISGALILTSAPILMIDESVFDMLNDSIKSCQWFTGEEQQSYCFARKIGSTTMPTFEKARYSDYASRAETSKIISEFAMKILSRKSNDSKVCDFDDASELLSEDLKIYIAKACQLSIMWIELDGNPLTWFKVHDSITRGEYATVLSRTLYGDLYEVPMDKRSEYPFYTLHMERMFQDKIITRKIPNTFATRRALFLTIYRLAQKLVDDVRFVYEKWSTTS